MKKETRRQRKLLYFGATAQERQAVKLAAAQRGMTMAALVRAAVMAYLGQDAPSSA